MRELGSVLATILFLTFVGGVFAPNDLGQTVGKVVAGYHAAVSEAKD